MTLYIIIESLAKNIAVQVMILSNQAKCDLQCPFKKNVCNGEDGDDDEDGDDGVEV